jgi:hypothetical protein
MPRSSNGIDYVKWKDPRTKPSKKPLPEPGPLPQFAPLQINNYFDLGEASLPPSLDRHDPLAIFKLSYMGSIVENQLRSYYNTNSVHRTT